ncbi:DUF805 domain-containing protein [Celeribacter sp. HF31]|uniref:DUF805 domain-containing protein n=1 Tax=Celeribacter sp. HF31 TaxID=2721558 RepID=UPI0014306C00|nr:DUF805 domain-containing protein [Celeribacter sp. HF31]NIY78952.1 DUF805 domain-containing protein [Celeribacter sp. HF31]
MTIVEAVKVGFRKYFVFSGRATREEFWKFILGLFLISIVVSVADVIIFGPVTETSLVVSTSSKGMSQSFQTKTLYGAGPISNLFGPVVLIPWLAAISRRLHDTGRAAWHLALIAGVMIALTSITFFGFLTDVPIPDEILAANLGLSETVRVPQPPGILIIFLMLGCFGAVILGIVWLARDGERKDNRYGPSPVEGGA